MLDDGLSMTASDELETWYREMELKQAYWNSRTVGARRKQFFVNITVWSFTISGLAMVALYWWGGR